MSRLPVPGQDTGTWGTILIDFLNQGHNADGTLKTSVVSQLLPYTFDSVVVSGTIGTKRMTMLGAGTIRSVVAAIDTTPGTFAVIVDVNKNGSTIFTTRANRPTINAGSNVSNTAFPDVTTFTTGDYFTVDINQTGTTPAGSNLVVNILVTYT